MPKSALVAQKNQEVLRQFLVLPAFMGVLLILVGSIGIYVNRHSTAALLRIDKTALGPTLDFDEIMAELNLLYQDLSQLGRPQITAEKQSGLLKSARSRLKRVDYQVKEQLRGIESQAFESYFRKWVVDWESFHKRVEPELLTLTAFAPDRDRPDLEITELIEKMRNISAYIQTDVKDMLEQSTRFSQRANYALMLTLLTGCFLGLVFTLLILKTIRGLFRTIDQAEVQLVQSSKLASLGEMSAGIAHEINNPLAIISGTVILLPRFAQDSDKLSAKVDVIQKACGRITRIVSGLKKFSRSSDQRVYTKRPLAEIVNEAMVLTESKSKRYDTPVTCDLRTSALIFCDEVEIEQVLINLIHNAVDAIKDRPERWVKVEIFDEAQAVVLRVTDSGPGIPEVIREKLFQPFFTTKAVGEGTGLGLSITKGILDQHQASITLPTDGPNTCFEVRFQRVKTEAA